MQIHPGGIAEIEALEAQSIRAIQGGREDEATRLWSRILEINPNHTRTLTALGQYSFRKGDMASARTVFQRVVDTDGSDPQQWLHLALASRNLKDEQAEESAITRALSIDPSDLLGLILRANLLERQGKTHEAANVNRAITRVSPPLDRLRADLRPAVTHALEASQKYSADLAAFLDEYLDRHFKSLAGENLKRFRDSLDIMVGRKKRYDSQPVIYHYPNLAPTEFFDRSEFPWLDEVEGATDEVRNEFLEILRADKGFTPYVMYPPDVPHNQWAELNHSPRWSAFHLYKLGKVAEENAARAPRTMKLLERVPQPDQPGRTPAALFSLLKPGTRIPPHTGVTNVRLVTHLALIIPEDCGFRVGNETRQWVPGKAWVFDDTIEHEAWNNSGQLRVVLIFDVWHPHLTPAERSMITALTAGVNTFTGGAGEADAL